MANVARGPGGRFDFDDGGSYSGDWSEGTAHGYGVCTGPRGDGEFSGAWQNGFETSGVYRSGSGLSGPIYEGQWLQGRRHGLGVDSRTTPGALPNGPRWLYRGEWTQGFRGRYGVRQSTATGMKYEGTWNAGLQDGYGVETYADGGTYEGQWLRGVRHGYGIRISVSYDIAARFPMHSASTAISIPVPGAKVTEKEDDILLRERDSRMEESRGGFVLRARTYPSESGAAAGKHRMVLDKHGRPSLRKTIVQEFRMIRQRSTGDLRDSTSRSASRTSGSVRSTSSQSSYAGSVGTTATSPGSVYSDEGSEASFVSQSDLPQGALGPGQELIERYLGEWKGDRRSGYGIAERTDGLRYEGEWACNRKHGYGVTIFGDGTRIEGKYKNNILVASVSGGNGSAKVFILRAGKMKDRVEAARQAAQRAADIARQKAEIANARMLSARMKAEQAEEVAKRATSDSELASSKAREYNSPGKSQPGSNIIANRPIHETEMQAEFIGYSNDGYDIPMQAPSTINSPPGKILSLFKHKKTPSQQQMDTLGTLLSERGPHQNFQTSTLKKNGPVPFQQQSNGYDRSTLRPTQPAANDVMQRTTNHYQQASYSPATMQRVYQGGNASGADGYHHPASQGDAHAFPSYQQQMHQYPNEAPIVGASSTAWSSSFSNAAAPNDVGLMRSSSTYAHGTTAYSPSDRSGATLSTLDSRRAAMMSSGGQRSFDDDHRPPVELGERRNSLPSIVKHRADVTARSRGTQAASAAAAARARNGTKVDETSAKNGVTSGGKPVIETFVIENGVRRRVRSIYEEQPSAGGRVSTGTAAVQQPLPSGGASRTQAIKTRTQKIYTLESKQRPNRGSVPDVSAISKDDVLPREVVSVLSQRRREELIMQREHDERRRQNQIVFRLGDMMDWCDRRRMLVLLMAINIGLATVFYNLLST